MKCEGEEEKKGPRVRAGHGEENGGESAAPSAPIGGGGVFWWWGLGLKREAERSRSEVRCRYAAGTFWGYLGKRFQELPRHKKI